jgi:Domain of unknown function (DUF5615)
MASPTVYFDECADHTAIPFLEARGITVTTPRAEGTVARSDPEQLRHSTRRGWVLLTTNRDHFFRLHMEFAARGEAHAGIITVPQEPTRPDRFRIRCVMLVAWVAATADPANRLFRWTDLQRLMTEGALADSFTEEEIGLALGQR